MSIFVVILIGVVVFCGLLMRRSLELRRTRTAGGCSDASEAGWFAGFTDGSAGDCSGADGGGCDGGGGD